MSRDYAKTSNQRRGSKKPAPKSSRLGLYSFLLCMGFGLGLLSVNYKSVEKFVVGQVGKLNQATTNQPVKLAKQQHKHLKQKVTKPEFEFYTILPSTTVSVAAEQGTAATNSITSTASVKSQKTNNHYMLQVASLKNTADAERLKARLTLMGFDVQIMNFNDGADTWYRVLVGPYQNLQLANNARETLQKNQFSSFVKRIS